MLKQKFAVGLQVPNSTHNSSIKIALAQTTALLQFEYNKVFLFVPNRAIALDPYMQSRL